MPNYKKAYELLKEVTQRSIYCDTCKFQESMYSGNDCDDCHRKNMGWELDSRIIEIIEKKCEIDVDTIDVDLFDY